MSALADLVRWLDSMNVPSTIIGGVAASILGRPRLTQDVDALVVLPEGKWAPVMSAAARFGIVPRNDDPLAFARRGRVLLMRHVASQIDIDVTLGSLPFEQSAVEQSAHYEVGGVRLRLPRVEDLLVNRQ
ncbi:MAG: hypothetical protein AB7G76_06940 [Steroidobacteraceae bacterium]